jgi:ABC-type branched-subunit amino acid transport system substrate-binding protein
MRAFTAAILLLAAAIGSSARSEILVGAAGPMSGKLTWIGEQLQRGTQTAIADINAGGEFSVSRYDSCRLTISATLRRLWPPPGSSSVIALRL